MTVKVELDQPLPAQQGLYLRGNQPLLGNWQFANVLLSKRSATQWAGIFILNQGDDLQFILDGGSPRKYFNGMDTVAFKLKKDTAVNIKLSVGDFVIEAEKPQGQIHNFPLTASGNLRARMVKVRTPIGYIKDTSRVYPVVILHDGQSLFDANKSPDKSEWRLDETLDSLELLGAIDPFILVAIDHVFEARSVEYADSEFGTRYRNYITNDLLPQLSRQFRLAATPQDRYIGGAVAGGYTSLLSVWQSPDIFGNGILLSPAAQIHENDFAPLLDEVTQRHHQLKFYLDIGEFGLDESLKPGVDSLSAFLTLHNIDHVYNHVPNSIPDSENMSRRVIPAILHFFRKED